MGVLEFIQEETIKIVQKKSKLEGKHEDAENLLRAKLLTPEQISTILELPLQDLLNIQARIDLEAK